MDEGGGGANDAGGADSYYGDYGDEKARQVCALIMPPNHLAVPCTLGSYGTSCSLGSYGTSCTLGSYGTLDSLNSYHLSAHRQTDSHTIQDICM